MDNIHICNFTDDTTVHIWDINLEPVLEKLEKKSELAVTWFEKTTRNEYW